MTSDRISLGKAGEDQAAQYLIDHGLRIVERNARTRFGEIDIVARTADMLVFVEVKAKSGGKFGLPEEMIGERKKHKLRQLALAYVREKNVTSPIRIDVIAIDHNGLRHYENAV